MPSTLTWIDHDAAARERALRILSLFHEKDSREELGLGAIRDSFADKLFPGTSTIQTRLRYMLFVPWVYTELERKRVLPPAFAERARRMETDLIAPLLESLDRSGVFGKVAGKSVKRLPSSVYWNGLRMWGIRRVDCSQDEYHSHVDKLYEHLDASSGEGEGNNGFSVWHPRLPDPPEGFPNGIDNLSFNLGPEESSFLLDRIMESHGESLLALLARNCEPVDCEFPWNHPERGRFSSDHVLLLDYAEFFSVIMQGAAFLYNLMLAELSKQKELKDKHRENLSKWKTLLENCQHTDLHLGELWEVIEGSGYTITRQAKVFVSAWHRCALKTGGKVTDDLESRVLVRNRERHLKGARSRFFSTKALERWGGYAGVKRMDYRWGNVKILLSDLRAGLSGGNDAVS
ncbi:MAG: hypothetical protein F4235_04425 [Candidatus Dadabacteria bacterium]|nr:hypothetical protein [Candidatus Dadabacteria bacterium]MYE61283.1 hypothetical protein [Candidatus Dadabacteria bacterium]MYI73578.1 hypothetical protein [Candidatus Dadabacteria bacterium]